MNIIGRSLEMAKLDKAISSNKPEFIVTYGRRRVGKTFLIRKYFKDEFTFYATGANNLNTKEELMLFFRSLKKYGCTEKKAPKDWFDAFLYLENLLESENIKRVTSQRKRVIFLDEVPWMDTPRSNFKVALDYFWNTYASTKDDIVLIICGSATSWIIDNIISDYGGFYNRVTDRIHLLPFTLKECEDFLISNNINWSRDIIIQCYMVFGGIPFYLNLLDNKLSLHQNINNLIFNEGGTLYNEYNDLMASLFKKHELHSKIINALGNHHNGLLRTVLTKEYQLPDGEPLTKALNELEACGFIRKYTNYFKSKNDAVFQLIDPFSLFCIKFKEKKEVSNWLSIYNKSEYNIWCGYAFEILVLNHVSQIKEYLGISGIESRQYAFLSKNNKKDAQIDLVIDRNDGVVNLCEMKYSKVEYAINKNEKEKIENRIETFIEESKTKSAVLMTLIVSSKLKTNLHSNVCNIIVEGNQLFR